jgi:membrane-associated protein
VEPLLLAAGAFAADGDLSLALLLVLVAACATTGDCIGYAVGRRLGYAALERHGRRVGVSPARLGSANRFLLRWTGPGVFITRWLLTPLGVPVNLLAGATRFPLVTFLVFDAAGETLWAAIYLVLGYEFGANWTVALQGIESVPIGLVLLLVGLVALAVGVWLLLRSRRGQTVVTVTPEPEA